MSFRRLAFLLVLAVASVPSITSGKPLIKPECSIVAYDRGGHNLTVLFSGVKSSAFVAAASANSQDSVWVQRGRLVKADGNLDMEAYDFRGRAVILRARNASGEEFLKRAQLSAEKGKPIAQADLDRVNVEQVCEFQIK